MPVFLHQLNVSHQCRQARLGLWACPPFLFLVLGGVNIGAMIASYLLASRWVDEPQVAALIVIGVSGLIFVVGAFIIQGFDRIAEANRLKSEFIAIISHQLRSPLAVFKWTIDAILSASGPASEHDPSSQDAGQRSPQSPIMILRENAEKMIQLVNMLLEVSRIEAGRLVLARDPIRLDLATEEIVRSYAAFALSANIALSYAAPATLAPVRGDRERIKMVIQNLVDNAIRYSRGGAGVVITLGPHGPGEVEWKIEDSGVGIPQPEQRFIFQKFFRSRHAALHTPNGSGLGLYIAQSVIAALGGVIGFNSQEGRGSTFWFRLPVYKA